MSHFTAEVKVFDDDENEIFSQRHGSPDRADALGWAMYDASAYVNSIEASDDDVVVVSKVEIWVRQDSPEVEADVKEQLATVKSFKDFAN